MSCYIKISIGGECCKHRTDNTFPLPRLQIGLVEFFAEPAIKAISRRRLQLNKRLKFGDDCSLLTKERGDEGLSVGLRGYP